MTMPTRPSTLEPFVDWLRHVGDVTRRQLASNIDAEEQLEPHDWAALETIVGSVPPFTMTDYLDWCYTHQCHGPALEPPLPDLLGRAITSDRFLALLYEHDGPDPLFDREEDARNFLLLTDDLDPASAPPSYLARIPLGRYLMWSTYDADGLGRDPETVLNGGDRSVSGSELLDRAAIETEVDAVADEVFVFVYRRETTRIHTPTIADAAGSGTFRPQPRLSGAPLPGLTAPPSGRSGIPEVVHEVVMSTRLARRLERYVV